MSWFDRQSQAYRSPVFKGLAGLSVLLALSACQNKDKNAASDSGQIVAQVNESEISIHQVQTMLQLQPTVAAQYGEAAADHVLDNLIEQELAAQAARKSGLDKSPKVLQAMEIAKREVLARAYQDQLAEKAGSPDSEKVDRYYETHPELFAQRRQYFIQETVVQANAEQALALKAKVEALTSVEAVNALLVQSGFPASGRQTAQWAEDLPMDILPRLADLKPGQSLTFVQPAGLVLLTLVRTEESPITRAQAGRAIQGALLATERKDLVKQGMTALRQQAKIERKGPLGKPAAAASAPAPAAEQGSAASAP